MNNNLKNNDEMLDYNLFCEKVKQQGLLLLVYNTNNGTIVLTSNGENIKKLKIPCIKIRNLELMNVNCDDIIFDTLKVDNLCIENSFIKNNILFNNLSETSIKGTFFYSAKETEQLNNSKHSITKIIPHNLKVQTINIKDNGNKWNILSNINLMSLELKNISITKFNDFPNLTELKIQEIRNTIKINYSELPNLHTFYSENNDNKINLDFINIPNLKEIKITGKNQKFIIENCQNLKKIFIFEDENHSENKQVKNNLVEKVGKIFKVKNKINNIGIIDFNKINSNNLCEIKIKDYKINDLTPLNKYIMEYIQLGLNTHPSLKSKEMFVISSQIKNFQLLPLFNGNTKIEYFNDYVGIPFDKIEAKKLTKIIKMLKLRKSTALMKKMMYNDLENINSKDLELINKKDITGSSITRYCGNIEALKVILSNKNYIINENDLEDITIPELKHYYEKHLIEQNIMNKNNITNKKQKIKSLII